MNYFHTTLKFFNKENIARLVSQVWPLGIFPRAPGTLCSLIAAFIGYQINRKIGSDITLLLAITVGLIGWFSSRLYISKLENKDPSEVVIDEFSGQLIATSAAGVSPFFNLVAFFLFRIFDILKPGIIKKAEKLEGATGIMMDDWLSGFIAALLLVFLSVFGLIKYNWFLI